MTILHPPCFPLPLGLVGFGVEGLSTLEYLLSWGIPRRDLYIFDQKCPDSYADLYKGNFLDNPELFKCRTLIRSPGIRPQNKPFPQFLEQGGLLTSQTEIFLSTYPKELIIGVTGTLGKGSCCSLIHHLLTSSQVPALLAGNFGIPFLDLPYYSNPNHQNVPGLQNSDPHPPNPVAATLPYVIAELSSFQLVGVKESPGRAVILQTTSEHLDWHADTQEYRMSKANLVRSMGPNDLLVYYTGSEGSNEIAQLCRAHKRSFGPTGTLHIEGSQLTGPGLSIQSKDIPGLKGDFQLQNLAAALLIALDLGVKQDTLLSCLPLYKGLEHRFEYIDQNNLYTFYNDSYATRPEATLGVLETLKTEPLGLILGGSDKGADFTSLCVTLMNRSLPTVVALIGHTSIRLAQQLREQAHMSGFDTLDPANFSQLSYSQKNSMQLASDLSSHNNTHLLSALEILGPTHTSAFEIQNNGKPPFLILTCPHLPQALVSILQHLQKGTVVLSPACASFGLFLNYKERGKQFKKLVHKILTLN